MPEVYDQFVDIATVWKNTTETCRTWSLPLKTASCTCCRPETVSEPLTAALKIAVDLVDEGMITKEEAVLKVEPKQLDSLLHPAVRRRLR